MKFCVYHLPRGALTLMLLVANSPNDNFSKNEKWPKPWQIGSHPESTQWELSNDYQHGRVKMV